MKNTAIFYLTLVIAWLTTVCAQELILNTYTGESCSGNPISTVRIASQDCQADDPSVDEGFGKFFGTLGFCNTTTALIRHQRTCDETNPLAYQYQMYRLENCVASAVNGAMISKKYSCPAYASADIVDPLQEDSGKRYITITQYFGTQSCDNAPLVNILPAGSCQPDSAHSSNELTCDDTGFYTTNFTSSLTCASGTPNATGRSNLPVPRDYKLGACVAVPVPFPKISVAFGCVKAAAPVAPPQPTSSCAAGQFYFDQLGGCIVCSPGFYCPKGTINPISCPKGLNSPASSESLSDCSPSSDYFGIRRRLERAY